MLIKVEFKEKKAPAILRLMKAIAALCVLLLAGCQQDNRFASFSAESRPSIGLAPVVDRTGNLLEGELSEQFTQNLMKRLKVLKGVNVQRRLFDQKKGNLFSSDPAWVKSAFKTDQFAILVELIEHHISSEQLALSAQVRVIDLRREPPRVLVQEVMNHSATLPKNLQKISWPEKGFDTTPVGMAHAKFIRMLAGRIDDAIMGASDN